MNPEMSQIIKQLTRIADELHKRNQELAVMKNELFCIRDAIDANLGLSENEDRKRGC